MIEATQVRDAQWFRSQLEEQLRALAAGLSAPALQRVDLPLLNLLVTGVGLSGCMLTIEACGRSLHDALWSAPESAKDATIVRQSSLRALEQVGRVLALVREWALLGDGQDATLRTRDLLHALNNVLVGINSYAELLLLDLRPDDAMYTQLQTILGIGNRAAGVVRSHATAQQMLTLLGDAPVREQTARTRDVLLHLAGASDRENLAVRALGSAEAAGITEHAASDLATLGGAIRVETVRRLDTLSTSRR